MSATIESNSKTVSKEIRGITYININSHSVTIRSFGIDYMFCKSTRKKPRIVYKTIREHGMGLEGGDRVVDKILNLPKPKENCIYIVNGPILEAIYECMPEVVSYFEAPGDQVRDRFGKITHAVGMYRKNKKINKDKEEV